MSSPEGLRVVVLTYGEGGEHLPLLDSLAAEGVSPERIVVVHNPSRPGERPAGLPEGVELVLAPYNLGYAAAMNLGVSAARRRDCELLLLLTHDARMRTGALDRMLAAAAAAPRYGALGPELLFTGGEDPYSFGGLSDASGRATHLLHRPAGVEEIAPCDWIDGGTMLLRAAALDAVGGFEERFWSYYEDTELCLRLRRAGWGCGIVVGARGDQDPGGTRRFGAWAYLMTRNGIAYGRRAAGSRGLIAAYRRALTAIPIELGRTLARAGGLRPGPPVERWAIVVGTVRGALAYAGRSWGPPPDRLPGSSDMKNVFPLTAEAQTNQGAGSESW